MENAAAARAELAQLDEGIDPLAVAEAEMNAAEERVQALAEELRAARRKVTEPSPRRSPPSWRRSGWERASSGSS